MERLKHPSKPHVAKCSRSWDCGELLPAELLPAELLPAELLPAELLPAELLPAELLPAELMELLPAELMELLTAELMKLRPTERELLTAELLAELLAAQLPTDKTHPGSESGVHILREHEPGVVLVGDHAVLRSAGGLGEGVGHREVGGDVGHWDVAVRRRRVELHGHMGGRGVLVGGGSKRPGNGSGDCQQGQRGRRLIGRIRDNSGLERTGDGRELRGGSRRARLGCRRPGIGLHVLGDRSKRPPVTDFAR